MSALGRKQTLRYVPRLKNHEGQLKARSRHSIINTNKIKKHPVNPYWGAGSPTSVIYDDIRASAK